ncbi:hypothetical protein T492DRAFT_349844 [Pavlovales sp. CCMP2436]|nr:hypothetical protein T492DRAFT_349844 [Pavlovales sp. CCMP2436]
MNAAWGGAHRAVDSKPASPSRLGQRTVSADTQTDYRPTSPHAHASWAPSPLAAVSLSRADAGSGGRATVWDSEIAPPAAPALSRWAGVVHAVADAVRADVALAQQVAAQPTTSVQEVAEADLAEWASDLSERWSSGGARFVAATDAVAATRALVSFGLSLSLPLPTFHS